MKKILSVVLAVVLVLMVQATVRAATLEEVIGQLRRYQAQNALEPSVLGASAYGSVGTEEQNALKPQQSQVLVNALRTVTDVPVSEIVSKTVRCGMRGDEDVKKLQTFLSAKGYLDSKFITGNFHAITKEALRRFQHRMQITGVGADGCIVGPLTKRALSVAY